MTDAGSMDMDEGRLRLKAETIADLRVISALCQYSVFPVTDMHWDRKARRFAILLNRLQLERRLKRLAVPPERVRTALAIDRVLSVNSICVDLEVPDLTLSLETIRWRAGRDAAGLIGLVLACGGVISVEVKCLDLVLVDVAGPSAAVSEKTPSHPD